MTGWIEPPAPGRLSGGELIGSTGFAVRDSSCCSRRISDRTPPVEPATGSATAFFPKSRVRSPLRFLLGATREQGFVLQR